MKKHKFNTIQKIVYVLMVAIAAFSILNFFSFGFLFAFAFGLSGVMQVIICFASLLIGSWAWAENEIAMEKYTF